MTAEQRPMNIAEYSIRKRIVTYLMCFLMMAGGLYAYEKIGRLEDPEFTIKDALVLTPYRARRPMRSRKSAM